jgi:hypothetical protein
MLQSYPLVPPPAIRCEHNVIWRHFFGAAGRIRHTPQQKAAFETAMAADLRAAAGRYPADLRLREPGNADRLALLAVVGQQSCAG